MTVKDTEHMLADPAIWTTTIRDQIPRCVIAHYVTARTPPARMRCWRKLKAKRRACAVATQDFNVVPEWDSEELTQVLLPLMKGE